MLGGALCTTGSGYAEALIVARHCAAAGLAMLTNAGLVYASLVALAHLFLVLGLPCFMRNLWEDDPRPKLLPVEH
jgi:L-alanine-DL-glutamate epimerase-like enolase superfamily enzyme